jgi:hypothetical protein
MPRVLEQRPDVVVFFAAPAIPSECRAVSTMCQRTMNLSDEMGLTDRHVFFD